jgi:hypothetical protein
LGNSDVEKHIEQGLYVLLLVVPFFYFRSTFLSCFVIALRLTISYLRECKKIGVPYVTVVDKPDLIAWFKGLDARPGHGMTGEDEVYWSISIEMNSECGLTL